MNRKPGAAVAGMTLVLLTAVLVSLSMGSVRVPVLSVLGQALGLLDIVVLKTELEMFTSCGKLYQAGLRGGRAVNG